MIGRISKLRGRSMAELRDRFAQSATQWLERYGVGDSGELTGQALVEAIGGDDGRAAVRGPFFASLDDPAATRHALETVVPDFGSRIVTRAERILSGRYDLLGHRDLPVAQPIDWWLDPVAGIRAPARHWSQISYLDPLVVGDHKLVWELARHRALVTLAQEAWFTNDARYAGACVDMLESWMDANTPKRGLHWASSLELAFRSIAWVWTLALLSDGMPAAPRRRAMGHLVVAGRHIERYLSTWFSPNTHLTGEALGLFVLGTTLPQCVDAERWRALGARILLEWLPRHVRSDGTYVEQSTWYHRYTTDFYLTFLVLANRSGFDAQLVREPLGRLLDVLAWITRPDGSMPLIGDDDGGRLVFLDDDPADLTRASLATGAALLERADLAAVAARPSTELVWILGPDGLHTFRGLQQHPPASTARKFGEGGLVVMRSGWDARASMMTVDSGPHGFLNAGHAHADALSVDLTVSGQPLFVDPGTFTYTTSPEWRRHFRSTAAHSAACVAHRDSADVAGAFSWATRCDAHADVWLPTRKAVLFSGTHDGFQRLTPPVSYRRSIIYLPPSCWIVRDEVDPPGQHDLFVHWQCAAGVEVNVAGDRAEMTLRDGTVVGLWMLEQSELSRSDGWVAPLYGTKVPAPHLEARPRVTRAGVLTTFLAAASLDVQVTAAGASSETLDVHIGERTGTVFFGRCDDGFITSTARLGWIERDPANGKPREVLVGGARSLSIDGVAVPIDANGNGAWNPA